MFRNYLKTGFRSLMKNKTYSIINILGSAIGIASFILVILYVCYELSYDKFFENSDKIYRVFMEYKKGNNYEPGDAQTYNLTGPTLKKEVAEITDFVRLYRLNITSFVYDNKTFEVINGQLADPSYFSIFKHPLLSGNPETALNNPNSIILNQTTSNKIFGKTNPIGKSLTAFYGGQKTNVTVTGILKDIPENTHMKTNFLISFQTLNNWRISFPNELNWNNNNYYTYLLINEDVDITSLKTKIAEIDFPNKSDERHNIEPLTSIHLNSDKPYEAEANGSAVRVKFLFIIAIIIIVLSWLNYMNLSTAKSLERSKEVGIRKVSGARKMQLISQFITEAALINLAAIIIALILVTLALPYFNSLTGKHLISGLSLSNSLFLLAGIPIIGIFTSALYPAILLSAFNPLNILKGKLSHSSQNMNLRKGFVITQFLITLVLLVGSLTVIKQMNFINRQPLGMNLNKIISIKGEIIDDKEDYDHEFGILKDEIRKLSFVKSVATNQTYPGEGYDNMNTYMGVIYPDGTLDERTAWYNYSIDEDYIPLMEINILAGQQFSENKENNKNKVIINEKAARKMGFTNLEKAVNQEFKFGGSEFIIAGILEDYHHFGLKNDVEPFVITYSESSTGLLVKLNENTSLSEMESAIEQLKGKWQKVFPKSTFQYIFVDEQFASLFNEERIFSKAFALFTFLAIFIASLGLFGVVFYQCILRTKEIGIRKVNGAHVSKILIMLNKDFFVWIIIAFIIACPIGWYIMNKWLQNFIYKTNLSWWIFALAGAITLIVALITASWQTWRAARRNPIEALRYE